MNPLEYLSIIVHCTIHHPLDLSRDDPACCTESSSSKITFYRFLLLTLHCQVKQVNFIHLSLTIGGTCYTIKSIVYKIWTNKNKVREKHIFHFYVQYFFELLLVLATFSFSLFLFFFPFFLSMNHQNHLFISLEWLFVFKQLFVFMVTFVLQRISFKESFITKKQFCTVRKHWHFPYF